MNTINITSSTYNGIVRYAKMHDMSMEETVEKALKQFINSIHIEDKNNESLEAAYTFIDTIPAKGTNAVPNEERGIEVLIDKKYAE